MIGRSAKTPRSDHRLKKKERLARSARTRRSFRRRRQRFSRTGARGFQYGVYVNLHLVQCLVQCYVGSVKHTTSPSHRDWSRRVIVSLWFNFGPQLRTPGCSGRYALRPSVSSRQPACRLRVPRCCCCWPVPVFPYSKRAKRCALGRRNLDTEQPFSYCYELLTQHRLESVATRTPPPICTSALGSLTALVWRAWGAASHLEIHYAQGLAIHESRPVSDSFASVARLPSCELKQVFESPPKNARVTIPAAVANFL